MLFQEARKSKYAPRLDGELKWALGVIDWRNRLYARVGKGTLSKQRADSIAKRRAAAIFNAMLCFKRRRMEVSLSGKRPPAGLSGEISLPMD